MPPNNLVLCCPLLLLPSIFSNELALHIRWPKNWSFSINPSNEYSGLMSFRIDWFSLLAVQETLWGAVQDSQESFLAPQFKSSDSSALSLVYGPTFTSIHDYWKNHSFDYTDLFNTLSRFVIAFFPRSKCLLISWLQSPCAVMLEPKKIKPVTVSIVSPSICHEVKGLDAMIFIFWMLSFNPAYSPLSLSSKSSLVSLHFMP